MRTLLALALLLCLGPAAYAEERPADARVFVETSSERDSYFVGEAFTLHLRIGFDKPWFQKHAVPLFRQEMDVPLQVHAAWLQKLEGATALKDTPHIPGEGPRFALEDRVVGATRLEDRDLDGQIFTVLELRKRYRALAPAVLSLPAPTVRFAHATRFEKDFLGDRLPLDRSDTVIRGAPLTVRVQTLPTAGRPAAFGGAIGHFTMEASVDRSHVEQGESLHLTLQIEGAGNLDHFAAPRLDDVAGFHVYGVKDVKAPTRRTLTYELAPVGADIEAIPPIRWAFYDRTPPAGYRVAATQPIPLTVSGNATGAQATEPADEGKATPGGVPALVWILAGLIVLAAARLWWRGRQLAAAHEVVDPRIARLQAARTALHAQMARRGADRAEVFNEYLAAHLDCAPAALITPDLPDRLEALGVSEALAERAARISDFLMAARYGSVARAEDAAVLDTAFLAAFERAVATLENGVVRQ